MCERQVVSGDYGNTVSVWDVRTGSLTFRFGEQVAEGSKKNADRTLDATVELKSSADEGDARTILDFQNSIKMFSKDSGTVLEAVRSSDVKGEF